MHVFNLHSKFIYFSLLANTLQVYLKAVPQTCLKSGYEVLTLCKTVYEVRKGFTGNIFNSRAGRVQQAL